MYRRAKITTVIMLILSALVFLTAVFYLVFSNRLGIYHWGYGLLSVAVMLVSFSLFSIHFRNFYALFLAPRCPRCGGVTQVWEIEIRGKTILGSETFPPILDRITKCTECGGEHHHIFAKWNEAGTTAPIGVSDSFATIIHDRASRMRLLRPAMTDEQIDKLFSKWDSYPKQPETSRAEWEATLKRLQDEAHTKNVASGMVFPKEKR
ncbi:MAG: hypothetical protein GX033_06620 [Firmicutes bacterium]|nr:hypothetical protein [Bacillota bacterium]